MRIRLPLSSFSHLPWPQFTWISYFSKQSLNNSSQGPSRLEFLINLSKLHMFRHTCNYNGLQFAQELNAHGLLMSWFSLKKIILFTTIPVSTCKTSHSNIKIRLTFILYYIELKIDQYDSRDDKKAFSGGVFEKFVLWWAVFLWLNGCLHF